MRVKLGDICEIVSGSTPKSNVPEYWDGDVKWITPAELNENSYVLYDSVRKITGLGVQKTGLTSFPAGTVILSSRAPIGKVAIAGCEMYCNQGFKNLICSDAINNKYLYWFLKGKTDYLNSLGRGATFKEISKQIVANVEIPLPPIERQKEIADQFEMVASVLRHRHEQLSALDDLIKARFVEMFGTVSNNRYGFRTKALADIATDFFAGGDKPNDCTNVQDEKHPYPVYANGFENEGLQGYSNQCRVRSKAVTISARGTIGYCFIRQADFTPVVRLITIVPNDEVSVEYLKYAIDTMQIKCSGTSQAQLTVPNFKRESIIVPPIDRQQDFANFVAQVDKSKSVIQKSLNETQLLFDSLMQQYFG